MSEEGGEERKGGIRDVGVGFAGGGGRPAAVQALPFRLLVVGDFGAHGDGFAGRLRAVDKDGFAALLAEARPGLDLRVPNHLGSEPAALDVALSFTSLRDFEPSGIAAQARALGDAIALRDAARQGRVDEAGLAAYDKLRAALRPGGGPAAARPPAPPAPSAGRPPQGAAGDDLDRLLGMVETGPAAPAAGSEQARAAVGSFIAQITGGAAKPPAGAPGTGAVEAIIAAQLDAILGDPDLMALEAAWRHLKFLVDRGDFRAGLAIEIVQAAKTEASGVLRDVVAAAEAARADAPLGLVLADYAFQPTAADLGLLQELAEAGEELQTPVLASAAPGFCGRPADEVARLDDPAALLEGAGYDQWNALRAKECARWLTLAYGDWLIRPASDLSADRRLGLKAQVTAGEPLWGRPAVALASLAETSHARSGWPTALVGREAGAVPDLALHHVSLPGLGEMAIPLAAPLGPGAAEGLARGGLVALTCQANRDAATVLHAPVVRRPPKIPGDDDGSFSRTTCTLPYQLLAASVAKGLAANLDSLARGRGDGEIGEAVTAYLLGLLAGTGAGAGAAAKVRVEDGERVLAIRVRSGRDLLGGVDLSFDVAL